jgi:hypothetical protein
MLLSARFETARHRRLRRTIMSGNPNGRLRRNLTVWQAVGLSVALMAPKPYPTSGPAQWFPVVAGAWLAASVIAVLAAPAAAQRLGERLAADEGFRTEQSERPSRLTDA